MTVDEFAVVVDFVVDRSSIRFPMRHEKLAKNNGDCTNKPRQLTTFVDRFLLRNVMQ
jgi:hypothetical protein